MNRIYLKALLVLAVFLSIIKGVSAAYNHKTILTDRNFELNEEKNLEFAEKNDKFLKIEDFKKNSLKNDMKNTINFKNNIMVEISGEVRNPGNYEMKRGDRFFDLIDKAGGLTEYARKPQKNYYLKDRMKFQIYRMNKQGAAQ